MVLKSKKPAQKSNQIASHDSSSSDEEIESSLITKSNGLKGPGCWCGARKWEGNTDVLVMRSKYSWLKFSGASNKLPVWQRPILMGGKCQLPGFSGLILYDDRGRPLPRRQNWVHAADVDSCNQVCLYMMHGTTFTFFNMGMKTMN